MSFTRLWLIIFSLCLGIAYAPPNPKPQIPVSHVIIISLDGARPDSIQEIEAPHLLALASRGSYSWHAQTVFPPATLPAHASLLSGLEPSQHLYDDNRVRECGDFQYPTIFDLALRRGYRTAMVVGKGPLCQFHTNMPIGYKLGSKGDRSVVDEVIQFLEDDYNFIWAHFPNPDYFGHIHGWTSETYFYELGNTDYEIGRLLDKIEELGLMETTVIFVVADHGGHDTVHGQDIPEDMNIPWIITGPNVRRNFDLAAQNRPDVRLIDVAPTLLWILDIPIPVEMQGSVICEAFIVSEDDCP